LESDAVRELIDNNVLTLEQAMALTPGQRYNLESDAVRELIDNNVLTLEQAMALTFGQRCNLESDAVRELIDNNVLTLEQAIQLTHVQYQALQDENTRQRLINGNLTIAAVLGGNAHGAAAPAPNINAGQSTHTTSVHKAVSESARNLDDAYSAILSVTGLDNVIRRIQTFVLGLSDDCDKNKAAKRCILRIAQPHYVFTDSTSDISTRQLLALTYLAIEDDTKRTGSLDDAKKRFVQALYEIQRGYNLSDSGVDDGKPDDRLICSGGTFNKLIEKLVGVHPDCEIIYITKTTASMKLPIVVREEAMRYIESLANPNTAEGLRAFTRLISQVKEDGIEVMWNQIKGNVADRMFDAFGSLYRDRVDHSFTGVIEAGQYTELPDLSIFQEQVQSSKGYHQFCSQMLRRPGIFFEHRHDNPEAQNEYDRNFDLVPRS
jgi:hypothetical protein